MSKPDLTEYTAWRRFYDARVSEWMDIDALRAEVGRLGRPQSPSPELLLIHAMKLLDARGNHEQA